MYAAAPSTGSTRDLLWSHLEDEILARGAAAGSDGAFTALYERSHDPLPGVRRPQTAATAPGPA
jgi:hypothetical protein